MVSSANSPLMYHRSFAAGLDLENKKNEKNAYFFRLTNVHSLNWPLDNLIGQRAVKGIFYHLNPFSPDSC